jgi:SAM-dependent methyltransferase
VSWQVFDREAERYEAWYATARGKRAFAQESRLLAWLLEACRGARTVLDVGCGCGRFTSWLAERGFRTVGLDRAPGMLACLRRRLPACPAVLADAHSLPLRDHAVDLVLLATTIEFLEDPRQALAEAVRAASAGVVVLALNRWSLGALSRRLGRAVRGAFLRHARDVSPRRLRSLLAEAAGLRLAAVQSRTVLLPAPLPQSPTRLPCGDIVGIVAVLRTTKPVREANEPSTARAAHGGRATSGSMMSP